MDTITNKNGTFLTERAIYDLLKIRRELRSCNPRPAILMLHLCGPKYNQKMK